MDPSIAVVGSGNLSYTMVSDLTLAGYKVNFLTQTEEIEKISRLGGINLTGEPSALISGKTGLAKPNITTTDPKKALKDVDIVFIDVPANEYETQIIKIAPHINDEQILNFNTYGYWASLRAHNILKKMNKENVVISESPAPLYWCSANEGNARSYLIRKQLPLAAFPGNKSKEVYDIIKTVFPVYTLAKNVLQTNFDNINMLIHPSLTLLNLGDLDRRENEKIDFYKLYNTVTSSTLADVQDRERIDVCKAYRISYTSLREYIIKYYGSNGNTTYEAINNCNAYKNPGWITNSNGIKNMISLYDVPQAMMPFLSLAKIADITAPITSYIVDIFTELLPCKNKLSLNVLGFSGLNKEMINSYVTEGRVET